ncbi:MAG: Fe(2+) transporter permease subunit FeoB [Defluviicoccus sp.]
MKAGPTIGLVGNPNCGKTTLFNALTGARQQVGNWPGVTVERKSGIWRRGGREFQVVDLPGVYALGEVSESSLDERVARDYILAGEADIFVNIVDASNLERNLYLTAQLIEMRVPLVIALNMFDIARERRIRIDAEALARELGCPVVPLVAHRGEGLSALGEAIERALIERPVPPIELGYDGAVEAAIAELMPHLAPTAAARGVNGRWLAVKLLEGDTGAYALVTPEIVHRATALQEAIAERSGEDADILVADSRYGFANSLIQSAVTRLGVVRQTVTDRIDRIVLHRLFGIPIFLVVMYALFLFTINVGSAFIDFFDQVAGTLLVDGGGALLNALAAPEWLTVLVAGGIGGGIQTVATFVPIIACLYLFLSFLEDCGYMARAAFVMDRLMRTIGLPGKSFIPLIVGFGCNVPAIMATRTLENRRDRILTVMMAPFMSCGARLPVYALFAAAFFPQGGQNIVFALYLIGIAFAVLTGLTLRHTLLKGDASPFVMELPPYHLPTLKGIVLRTWDRLKSFVIRAGRIIIVCVVALNTLGSVATDGSFGHENTERSLLASIGRAITPAFAPMGLSKDNWPATVGLFTGIFAKEAVVGTLDALYTSLAAADAGRADEGSDDGGFDLGAGLLAALATIPANLAQLADALTDPLGLSIASTPDLAAAAETQGVAVGTFGAMASRFDGQIGAFAYLLAVLLYLPCVSAVAAIWRETGPMWTIFSILWTTGLAYGAAVIVYQVGTWQRDPGQALAWTAGVALVFAGTIIFMRQFGLHRPSGAAAVPAE